jgi:hypothetical protein
MRFRDDSENGQDRHGGCGCGQSQSSRLPSAEAFGEASSPGRLFDRLVHEGVSPSAVSFGENVSEEAWDTIALPHSAIGPSSFRRGDLIVQRALGEGKLAFLRVLGEEAEARSLYGDDGLIRRDTLVLRRRSTRLRSAPQQLREAYSESEAYLPENYSESEVYPSEDYSESEVYPSEDYSESEAYAEQTTTVDLGSVTLGSTRFGINVPTTGDTRHASVEEALRAALGRAGQACIVRGSLYATGEARVCNWTPSGTVPAAAPPVAVCEARAADLCAVIFVRGNDALAYFPALRVTTTSSAADRQRWVVIPGLADFYRLPDAVRQAHRRRWITQLGRASTGFARPQLEALSTPALRLLLAQNAATAFSVDRVNRGKPPSDRGGVVNGVTLPLPTFPLTEPACYLAVISEAEGRLESINAWDAEAGISLGPIQFNVNPPEGSNEQAIFRFLWRLFTDDQTLFTQAFGDLGYRMRFDPQGITPSDNDYFVLLVNAGRPNEVSLRSVRADKVRNYRYFQTGVPDQTGFVPAFRRDLAARFRSVVAWPHVQQMILDTSSRWLQPGLAHIRAAGIPALDLQNPDRDTFVLTSVLLSTYVRFSGCLRPLLQALARWTTVADKIAHLSEAVGTLQDPCPTLRERLNNQVTHARAVHAGLESIRRARAGTSSVRELSEDTTPPRVGAPQPEAIPRSAAPHILEFRGTSILASDPLAFRGSVHDKAAEILQKLNNLGIKDEPRGRCDAYVDAIAWNESNEFRRGLRSCPTPDGNCIASSCGLVVRSLWRLLGARDVFFDDKGRIKLLDPPYKNGSVMANLRRFAELCGALKVINNRADFDRANPQRGDAIFINKDRSQHVFTLIDRNDNRFVSIDGGQGGNGDGNCCGIRQRTRTLPAGSLIFTEDQAQRPITAVVKLASLRFTARLIDIERAVT